MKKLLSATSFSLLLCWGCNDESPAQLRNVPLSSDTPHVSAPADTMQVASPVVPLDTPATLVPVKHVKKEIHYHAIKHGSSNQSQLDSMVKAKTDGKFKKK